MLKRLSSWLAVLTFATLLLGGCASGAADVPPGTQPAGAGGTPAAMPAALPAGTTVLADGQLASPYPSLPLGFGGGVSGTVLTITVQAGDVVQAGAPLALLDDTDLRAAVEDAQRALDRATADRERAAQQWERDLADAQQGLAAAERALATARLQYSNTTVEEATTALDRAREAEENAHTEYLRSLDRPWEPQDWRDSYYDRWQGAIRDRELSEMRLNDARDTRGANSLEMQARQEDIDKARRTLAALQAGMAPTHERAVEDAQQQLDDAERALTHARLDAPWSATVLSVDVAPGASAGAGTPVVTLLSLEDGLRFVTQNLSEQHVVDVRPGQRAVVSLRTFPETPLEGRVEAVVPQVGQPQAGQTNTTDARFTVRVRLDPAPAGVRLMPGLTGRAEIYTQDEE